MPSKEVSKSVSNNNQSGSLFCQRIIKFDRLACLLGPHAGQLVQLDGPVLAALVHLDPPGLHVGVELVLLLVEGHLVRTDLAGLQGGVHLVSGLPPGLAVRQHGAGLLQAVGGAVPCLALGLSPVNPTGKCSKI